MKVILDCDNTMGLAFREVDDGLGLLYLLGVPEVELIGVTTTFGNGSGRQVYQQTRKLVADLKLDIPVLRGEERTARNQQTEASHFLVEAANQYAGELSIIATGPLGNLASTARMDAAFFSRCRQIICMGGYFEPLKLGRLMLKELNFSANPLAAYQVLNADCPLTVMSGQICTQASLERTDIERMQFWSSELRNILRRWLALFGILTSEKRFYLWDLLPAVYLTQPQFFDKVLADFSSSLDDLSTGKLIIKPGSQSNLKNFPSQIVQREQFFDHLWQSWQISADKHPL